MASSPWISLVPAALHAAWAASVAGAKSFAALFTIGNLGVGAYLLAAGRGHALERALDLLWIIVSGPIMFVLSLAFSFFITVPVSTVIAACAYPFLATLRAADRRALGTIGFLVGRSFGWAYGGVHLPGTYTLDPGFRRLSSEVPPAALALLFLPDISSTTLRTHVHDIFMIHHILIAGGGIGGMAAALALINGGHEVDVYEQAEELKEFGAGVQISPNGTRALHALGVLDRLRQLSCDTEGKEVRLWNTGRTWKLFDLGTEAIERYGFPYITVFRPDLLQVLVDAIRARRPHALHLGRRAVGVTQSCDRVMLRFEDGDTAMGDALIGADGIHSAIRRELFGGDNPRFFGMIAWRGVIPIERVPQHISHDKATNWIGVGGHVVHYPLRAGKLMNFVGIQERADWQVESWTTQGTPQECANDHAGWHEDVQALIAASPSLFKWALMGRDPLPQWTVGRVTLLGDACHPTLPMLAQGAVMAIEDAVILGRCFDKYGDIATALSRYQDARIAVTARKVAGANDNAKRFHNPALGTEQDAAAYVDREWSREAIIRRYEWIFTYNVDAVEI